MSKNILQTKYLIVGAGLSGLSTAYHLKNNYLLLEASDSPGGTATTLYFRGFKLDNSVHVLYFKHKTILDWIRSTLQVEMIEKTRKSSVWIKKAYVNYPIQYHLAGLPFFTRLNSFKSILSASLHKRKLTSQNFEEYSLNTFGNYLTDIFIRPYNEKMFGVLISEINIDWMGDYIPNYSTIKMLMSITGLTNGKYGRNSEFYYPAEGGIVSLAKRISSSLQVAPIFNYGLIGLSFNDKTAKFKNGLEIKYEYLINTIPLKNFLQTAEDLPTDISHSLGLLKMNSTTLLHILGKGRINRKEHWIYIPDPEIPFYRITLPGNINPINCPSDHFALTLEFGGDVFESQSLKDASIVALKKMGILNEITSDLEFQWRLLDCGYVVYDRNRIVALKKILSFLLKNQTWSIGRYGGWEYSNMEDAILSGRKIAEKLIKQN